MESDSRSCNAEVLSRFLDRETGAGETVRMQRHLENCAACRKMLETRRALSRLTQTAVAREISQVDFGKLEAATVSAVQNRRPRLWRRMAAWMHSKKLGIPAAAAALVMLAFFFVEFQRPRPQSPSAIINSFTGSISSVMILETPKTRETILWFDEDLPATDDDRAV